jgi:hypothetical protein
MVYNVILKFIIEIFLIVTILLTILHYGFYDNFNGKGLLELGQSFLFFNLLLILEIL